MTSSYSQPKAIRFLGASLDVTSLQQALDHIVARHEVLRTTFASEGGNPRQVIPQSRTVELPAADLRACPDLMRQEETERLLKNVSQRPLLHSCGKLLLDATRTHYGYEHYVMTLTLFHTGLRASELAGLQWPDLDFRGRFVHVRWQYKNGKTKRTKTKKIRKVDISDALLQ
jgi:integrase